MKTIAVRLGILLLISFSNYWPAWGGVNGSPDGHVASGDEWQEWKYKGAACPKDWPFGTKIILDGQTWTCVDRGAFVGYNSKTGAPIVDFLTDKPKYAFRQHVEARVIFPEDRKQKPTTARRVPYF